MGKSMPALLDIQSLSKSFGSHKAVDALSLQMPAGCVFGLLGPNGAGKTTLLRLISTLLRPDNGQVLLDGHCSVRAALQVRARLGLVNANMGLYERFTGRENLQLYGQLAGMGEAAVAARIMELRKQLDIGDWIDARAKTYSTGMRQKILIGRAVVHSPPVLILDEASNGLDVYARRGLFEFVRQFADSGALVIYSTHIMSEAEQLCQHVALMDQGKLLASARTTDLLAQTRSESLEAAFFELADAARHSGARHALVNH